MTTIAVTGAAGFIGSHFVTDICATHKDIQFVLIDSLTYAADFKVIESYIDSKRIHFEKTDIRDVPSLKKVFDKFKPTGVVHFAAESHVDRSITNPNIFIETNVIGTQNLLNLSLDQMISGTFTKFLHVSTDEVYGDLREDEAPFSETSQIKPNSPYSASKAASDLLVAAYHCTYGLPTITTRCSNNYGPHQNKEKFLPVVINSILSNKKIPVYGNGKNIRDWIYVKDHIEGIWKAFNSGRRGEVYNFGGNNEVRNIDMVKYLLSHLKMSESLIEYVQDRKGHDWRYAIDATKAKNDLAWTPTTDFKLGIQKTIDFYRSRKDQ
jgi:dTDP-glucose 4,6-dehydratase